VSGRHGVVAPSRTAALPHRRISEIARSWYYSPCRVVAPMPGCSTNAVTPMLTT
jgi:hypothetical protein